MGDTFSLERFHNGYQDNLDIQPERPMVDIPNVVVKLLFPGEGIATVDLSPSSDAGKYFVAASLLGGISLQVLGEQWSRTDYAHLTTEDIEELGELVQASGAKEAPQGGDTLAIGKQTSLVVIDISHRAKLEIGKRLGTITGTHLAEDHWRSMVDKLQDGNQQ